MYVLFLFWILFCVNFECNWNNSFVFFVSQLVCLLSVCGAGGIACMFLQMPLLQVCSFIAFMCCGMAVNIVNAATVDLYPTSSRYSIFVVITPIHYSFEMNALDWLLVFNFIPNRAMAVSISLMFGRLGCVLGANVSALFIESHCELVFYLFGSSLIRKQFFSN